MIVRTFTNSFGLLVGDLGLEPRSQLRRRIYEIKENIAERSLLQDSLIENGLPRPVRLPIPPVYPYENLKVLLTFAIQPMTFNHIQSVGRHGLSIG